MDPKSTGRFISSLRKEKNMTQKQLAEKLCVSDKAVSRWETGRGYPDTESLMALSREFSVSVNELLYGKRTQTPAMAQSAEKEVAGAYLKTTAQKRRIRILAVCLAVMLAFCSSLSLFFFRSVYKNVIGSASCVIASDYSYLTLYGERYVPLVLENAECKVSECLISEAQVEGKLFIDKLLFGEAVYSVKQCANNDIVYLQTDYDLVLSHYYCKENKADEYQEISQSIAYNQLTAEILTKDEKTCDIKLNDTLSQLLTNSDYTVSSDVNCNWSRSKGDESIVIYSSQTQEPFRRKKGELIRKKGEYYWFDYGDIPETQHNADFSAISAYEISNRYDKELDVLFSYMFQ